MRLEKANSTKLAGEIRSIVEKYLPNTDYRLFFFGSRVAGTGDKRSDIDIGIESKPPVPSSVFLKIKDELENLPILYKIDFVDFNKVSSLFRQTALSTVEYIQ